MLDVRRAAALATALDAFIGAGLVDHARPVARELAELLRAADRCTTVPIDLDVERAKRRV